MSRGMFIMSEYFLRLDPNNYDNKILYLLENNIFSLQEFNILYKSGKINKKDWQVIKDYKNVK